MAPSGFTVERRNGKPTGWLVVEVQAAGQRKRTRVRSIPEVEGARAALLLELQGAPRPQATTAPGLTLSAAIEAFHGRLYGSKAVGPQALSGLRRVAKVSSLGDRGLGSLVTQDIDRVIEGLEAEGVSGATINRHLSWLRTLLTYAQERGHLDRLPAFDWQEEDEGRVRWITPDEEGRLLAYLREQGAEDVAALVEVAIDTGLRRGELFRIRPEHVEAGQVHVWITKTKRARTVPLTARAARSLATQPQATVDVQRLRYWWDRARTALGLASDPWFVFHACRHTCATRLVKAGVNILVVQRVLGHANIQTTMRYAHVEDADLRSAVAKLENVP